MNTFLAKLRLCARIPALVLLLAILAPVFITVLPAPAMSAEQQLLTAIAASNCAQTGEHQQRGNQNLPMDHHRCCVLCTSPGPTLAAADASPIIERALKRLKQPQQAALQIILSASPQLEWTSPRGPPTQPSA